MPFQTIKDPQTGAEREVYMAPKAAASQPKPAAQPAGQSGGGGNPLETITNAVSGAQQALGGMVMQSPIGIIPNALQTGSQALGAGVQELTRTGDLGRAGAKAQQVVTKALQAPTPQATIARVAINAARNAAQEVSDVTTADIPAALGAKVKPTSAAMPDAPFLGVMPALPKLKSTGPAEDLATGIAQFALEWIPAARAVGLVGKGLKMLPGAAKVAEVGKGATEAYKAAKAAQISKLAPSLQKPATIATGAAEAVASNVLGKSAATGALIDFAGFDQYGGRLYDLADNLTKQVTGTPLEIPFLDYLKSNPGDVGVKGRLKNAVEGVFVGSTVEFLMRAFRAGKYVERLRNAAPEEKPAAAVTAAEATDDLEREVVNQAEAARRTQVATAALAPQVSPKTAAALDQANATRNELQARLDMLEEPPRPEKGEKGTDRARAHTAYVRERNKLTKGIAAAEKELVVAQEAALREQATPITPAAPPPATAVPAPEVPATPAAAPVAPAAEAKLPDTRGQGEFFHGTAKEIQQLDEGYYESRNIYGQGFYTTDDLKTAGSYTKKNRKAVAKEGGTPDQVIYRITENQPVSFYDLDAPISATAKQYLETAADRSESVARALDEVDANPEISLAKVMDEIRANSRSAEESRDTIQEVFDGVREALGAEGYGGYTHLGGKLAGRGQREHQVKIYWDPANQISIERYQPETPAAPAIPAAAVDNPVENAPPVVANATPAVAAPSAAEIADIDATLAKSMADRTPEERVAIRDQMLAQKYGTPAPAEAPAAAPELSTAAAPEPVAEVEVPVDVQTPVADEAWANQFVDQILANRAAVDAGDLSLDDLLLNNVQKLESPSGRQYQPIQPQAMVEAYRAHSDLVSRPDATGIPVVSDQQIIDETATWLEKANYSSKAVLENLKRLSGPLSAYQENLVALRAAALYVDHTNLQAGTAASRWLNGQMDEAADMGKLTAELVTAASQQDRANRAFESVTRPLGQLLRSTQVPRPEPGSIPFDDVAEAMPPVKDVAADFEKELAKDQDLLVAETIGERISPEAKEAIVTGDYSNPKVVEEFNALALNMAQGAVTPGFSQGFWKKFNESTSLGAQGLMMYRSSQLLSSGITLWGNVLNSALRTVELPLTQAMGALVTGSPVRASRSLMIYGQYASNLINAFRMGVESFKVGRGLFDLDRSQVDFLDRLAAQDAQSELLAMQQKGEWNMNTVPWLSVQDKSNWAMAQKRLWQGLNLSSRLQVSVDSAFKTLVGQSFEYVRNLQPGLDHAVRMGMEGTSKEAWKFAQDYAQAAVDRRLKDLTIEGKTILDGVMDSPYAQTATRWATFTDDIWASMETRTMQRGMEMAEAKGLKGDEAQAFAQDYLNKGAKVLGMAMDDIPFFARTFSLMPKVWQMGLDSQLGPLFALIQPFNRTPGDIVKSVARKTPLAPLVDTWWRDVFSEDAMTRDRAWGDVATGAAAISMVSLAMTHGGMQFTGGGPIQPEARRKWNEQDNKQPYSFRYRISTDENGNTIWSPWISMRALDPYSSLFGGLADYHELANKVTTEARERLGSALVLDLITAVGGGQLSKTYYQGFSEFTEMALGLTELDVSPNRRHPAARYLERLAASFIPNSSALRAGRRIEDPIAREVPASNNPNIVMRLFEETANEIKNMIPGWSSSLPPKRNWITGDPIVLSGVWGDQFLPPESPWLSYVMQFNPLSPFQLKRDPGEKVLREMGSLTGRGAGFVGPRATDFTDGGKIKANRLDSYEFEQYVLAISRTPDQFGRTLLQALEETVDSDLYKENPQGAPSEQVVSLRAAAINQVIAQYLQLGRETFLSGPYGKRLSDNRDWAEGANRDVQFRLKYGQAIDPKAFVEALR